MRKSFLVLAAAALLLLSGTAAWAAPTILIDDTQEGELGVTFPGFATNPSITAKGNEWVVITGFLSGLVPFGTIGPKGSYLTEAGVSPPTLADVSDIAFFFSDAGNYVAGFASDGAREIDFNIPGLVNFHADTFIEARDAFNVLFPFDKTSVQGESVDNPELELFLSNPLSILSIKAKSDVDPSPIPLPPSVWLLGSGLLGLVGFRKKFRA